MVKFGVKKVKRLTIWDGGSIFVNLYGYLRDSINEINQVGDTPAPSPPKACKKSYKMTAMTSIDEPLILYDTLPPLRNV